mgnify:FL=1
MYPNVDVSVRKATRTKGHKDPKQFRRTLTTDQNSWEMLEIRCSMVLRTHRRGPYKSMAEAMIIQCRNPAALDFVRQEVEKAVWKLHNVKLEPPTAFVGRDGSDVGKK